jgi:hypothetical protein
MKVKIEVEFDVEPDSELNARDHHNVVGMLARLTRNRVQAYLGKRVGGERASTGWEVTVKDVAVNPLTKTKGPKKPSW